MRLRCGGSKQCRDLFKLSECEVIDIHVVLSVGCEWFESDDASPVIVVTHLAPDVAPSFCCDLARFFFGLGFATIMLLFLSLKLSRLGHEHLTLTRELAFLRLEVERLRAARGDPDRGNA